MHHDQAATSKGAQSNRVWVTLSSVHFSYLVIFITVMLDVNFKLGLKSLVALLYCVVLLTMGFDSGLLSRIVDFQCHSQTE